MKYKSQPIEVRNLTYLEQACIKGLNKRQRAYALKLIREEEAAGRMPFYNLIRKGAERI